METTVLILPKLTAYLICKEISIQKVLFMTSHYGQLLEILAAPQRQLVLHVRLLYVPEQR